MVTGSPLESLRGIADPTRRTIVERLSSGGLAVGEIAAGLPMSRPAVSKHLRVLRELGLVVETRVGRRRIYELVAEPLEEIVAWLERLAEAEGTRRDPGAAEVTGPSPVAPERGRRPATPTSRRPSRAASAAEDDEDGDHWRSW